MKVFHIIDRLPPDGAERLLVDVLKNRSKTIEYQVICLVSGGELANDLHHMGIGLKIFAKKRGLDFKLLWSLTRYLRQQKPDVVHTHLFTADSWGRLAARLASVPKIFSTAHSVNAWKKGYHHKMDKLFSLFSDKIIACAPVVAQSLQTDSHIHPDKIITISNGIDLQRFSNVQPVDLSPWHPSKKTVTLAIIGRLHPAKGQLAVLPMMQAYQNMGLDFHLLLVGEGALASQISAEIERLNLKKHVSLLGQRADVPQLLAAIDVLLMPSQWEGLPMALLEAMAMGKAVVAYAVGGIADVIQDNQNGFLVAAQDQQALTQKTHRLLVDAGLRHRLGAAAKTTVLENYNAAQVAKQYEALYG